MSDESRRWKHFAAMALIGDGVMAVLRPEDDAFLAWKHGPAPWKALMGSLAEHPTLTRCIGAAQIVGGIWWALHQSREYKPEQTRARQRPLPF
ncbi:hypothetical protein GCM10011507_28980 [Edaphobacter acidisoli]|uniref:Uncharacterized protein n=1 Tax=Edaphobacter acidisoli TaxID=2040573 RepID=A0A916RXZ9_9BACT|nr:hypothetical protein [Edaphobacter acidisoli]GGA75806.1 hypothetical protein GCM10011507_28980 [Edaphobacter acidisoli]